MNWKKIIFSITLSIVPIIILIVFECFAKLPLEKLSGWAGAIASTFASVVALVVALKNNVKANGKIILAGIDEDYEYTSLSMKKLKYLKISLINYGGKDVIVYQISFFNENDLGPRFVSRKIFVPAGKQVEYALDLNDFNYLLGEVDRSFKIKSNWNSVRVFYMQANDERIKDSANFKIIGSREVR